MSDVAPSPSPAKGGQQANKNQVILVAVLGAVLLLALVFFVLKPFSGGDDTSAPTTPSVATPAAPAAGAVAATPAPPAPAAALPAAPRGRNPFDPPR